MILDLDQQDIDRIAEAIANKLVMLLREMLDDTDRRGEP